MGLDIEYIRAHLGECSTENGLEWLSDLDPEDAVTEADIYDIYES